MRPGASRARANAGRIGRPVTSTSDRFRSIAWTTAWATRSADTVPKIVGAVLPAAWWRAKMPAPVTKPGMRAENPTPLPAYSTRRLWVAAASPAFAAAYGPPVGKWPEAGEGTNVDYVAAAAGHQPGEHLSDQLERYQKIERDDLAELGFGVAGVGRR